MSRPASPANAAPPPPSLQFELATDAEGSWDELRGPGGVLRAPWQRFFLSSPAVASDPAAAFVRNRAAIEQQIHADGVTHNLHLEQAGNRMATRAWSLEALPLIVEPADWAQIEHGVIQRARLFSAMLADLYGPRRLLHDALLPSALVFRNSGYLRPLHGVRPVDGMHLHIAAFDIARGADGRWWVVSQRTQSPSGLGYVLHNRLIVSRLYPEAFRDLQVQHIASAYRRLLDTLQQQAAEVSRRLGDGAIPRVVLLTAGLYSETYFEHAHLARYLGLPLVEGDDLTVRGDRLYLRTVEGLEPVHGLIRRLDDDYCDPLELRPDSALGVAGLVQVLRAGKLVMANALGSGVLESSAVQGFLPAISQSLLGEPLALPSLPTWWCGEAAAWAAVREMLPGRVLRTAFGDARDGARRIADRDVPDVQAQIDADPEAFVVQDHLAASRAPLPLADGSLAARPAMLRIYAMADAGGQWHVLPGALTRMATRAPLSVSMQQGGTSLDTWVVTSGPVDTFSMLAPPLTIDDLAARRAPVASRAGENLFWLGRYTERTEQVVRLALAMLRLIDGDDEAPPSLLAALSRQIMDIGLVPEGTPGADRSPLLFERSLQVAVADRQRGALSGNLDAMARCAGALRDYLSAEHWGLVRRMADEFHRHPNALGGSAPMAQRTPAALRRLALQLAAVTGAQTDRMTRDHGWRLLSVGRLIERLIGMASVMQALLPIIDPQGGSAQANLTLLRQFDSAMTFRARYQRQEDLLALVDLLVLDDTNPRAFAGTLRRLRTELAKLPGPDTWRDELRASLPAQGAGLTLESLRGCDMAAVQGRVIEVAQGLQGDAARLSDLIGQRLFAHAALGATHSP